jgi:hypothetical protein
MKGDKTDCCNYRGILPLSPTNKILSSILLSRLTPCEDEIVGDHQCGFPRNRWNIDQMFCISHVGTGEKVGVQWDSTIVIYSLQKAYD